MTVRPVSWCLLNYIGTTRTSGKVGVILLISVTRTSVKDYMMAEPSDPRPCPRPRPCGRQKDTLLVYKRTVNKFINLIKIYPPRSRSVGAPWAAGHRHGGRTEARYGRLHRTDARPLGPSTRAGLAHRTRCACSRQPLEQLMGCTCDICLLLKF